MFKGKNEVEEYPEDFDGVFKFTNATDEDFTTLWNNKEYTYPAGKTVPMVIANEPLENIQQIRKYFAKRLAEREYLKSKGFSKIANGIKNSTGLSGATAIQSSYDERDLQPWIDECLKPLELGTQKVKSRPAEELEVAGKALGGGNKENPYPAVDLNETFKEENEKLLARRS